MELPFKVKDIEPCKNLLPFVRRWILFEYIATDNYIHEVAPTGTLFINHAYNAGHPKIIIGNQSFTDHPKTIFVGHPIRNDIKIDYHPGVKLVFAEFTFTGFYRLFKIDIEKLKDQGVGVQILGHETLSKSLNDLEDPLQIKDAMESYLQTLIPEALPASTEVDAIIASIEQDITSLDLKQFSPTEHKRIYRLFKKYTGLSIKQFHRIYQLNHIINLMRMQDFESLTALGMKAGYYDQSDFIKHIKYYLGQKPSTLINAEREVLFQFMGGTD